MSFIANVQILEQRKKGRIWKTQRLRNLLKIMLFVCQTDGQNNENIMHRNLNKKISFYELTVDKRTEKVNYRKV